MRKGQSRMRRRLFAAMLAGSVFAAMGQWAGAESLDAELAALLSEMEAGETEAAAPESEAAVAETAAPAPESEAAVAETAAPAPESEAAVTEAAAPAPADNEASAAQNKANAGGQGQTQALDAVNTAPAPAAPAPEAETPVTEAAVTAAPADAGASAEADEAAKLPHYLTPYQTVNMDIYDNDEIASFVMMGTEYKQGAVFSNYEGFRAALYNLDGKFSMVTLEVGHMDGERDGAATLYIYLDGAVTNTVELTSDMITQKISLDTTGKTQLRLEIDGYDAGYAFANVVGYGGHTLSCEMTKMVSVVNDGEYTYTCRDCGYTYTEVIPKKTDCVPYLTPYQMSNWFALEETEEVTDYFNVMGVPHFEGLSISNYEGYREALYNLGQTCDSVTFTVGHIDGERLGEATLRVFADGQQMKEIPLEYTMMNQTITINTQGVIQLKLAMEGWDAGYGIVDMSYVTNAPKQHAFVSEVVLEAAVGQSGICTYTCQNCGASYSEAIPALEG